MGLFDRVFSREVFNREHLAEFPATFDRVPVERLEVHTANLSPDTDEKIIIVTTVPAALEALRGLRTPVQFLCDGARPVIFAPSRKATAPILDPKRGWLVPISAETAAEIDALPPGPGEHELRTTHLGLVLE